MGGAIPSTIGELKRVTTLSLSQNQLRGTVPFSINKLIHVQKMRLNSNHLEAPMPDLSGLESLQMITAFDNIALHHSCSGVQQNMTMLPGQCGHQWHGSMHRIHFYHCMCCDTCMR